MLITKSHISTLLISGLSLVLLIYLIYRESITGWGIITVIKTTSALIFPVPIALYFRYILNGYSTDNDIIYDTSFKWELLKFTLSFLPFTTLAITSHMYNLWSIHGSIRLLHIANSVLINAYLVNRLTLRNQTFLAVICGIHFGLALTVFSITY